VATTIRILVRPPVAMPPRRVTGLVKAALARTRWGREREVHSAAVDAPDTSAARHDVLVEVESTERSADTYASHAHELVQLLYDTEQFLRVEADIATAAFDPAGRTITGPRPRAAAGSSDCSADAVAAAHDWALQAMNVPAALALMAPNRVGGRGVVVGHPDSGYSDHPMLGLNRLDLTRDRDVISNDDDARDPLRKPKTSIFNLLPNPGHGSSTASVLVGNGQGMAAGAFHGVANAATLVPIRATESVVQVFDTDVAKAVRWARQHGCHVVSMSLGGKGLFGLEDAIQEAVDDGMVVLAAAGNQVGFVTAPASYDNCLAVAATTSASKPWDGSSRGSQVDLSAPGACVWAALFDWKPTPPAFVLRQSDGTSYAVAHVAGVVALWMAHHGHAVLVNRFGKGNVQAALLSLLRAPGVCRVPPQWDRKKWGSGIIDAAALLRAPLPAPHAFAGRRGAVPTPERDPIDRLAASLGRSRADTATAVDRMLGAGASGDLALVRRFEGELAFHLADPATRDSVLVARRGAAAAAGAAQIVVHGASPQLRQRMGLAG
jgi:serine protease